MGWAERRIEHRLRQWRCIEPGESVAAWDVLDITSPPPTLRTHAAVTNRALYFIPFQRVMEPVRLPLRSLKRIEGSDVAVTITVTTDDDFIVQSAKGPMRRGFMDSLVSALEAANADNVPPA